MSETRSAGTLVMKHLVSCRAPTLQNCRSAGWPSLTHCPLGNNLVDQIGKQLLLQGIDTLHVVFGVRGCVSTLASRVGHSSAPRGKKHQSTSSGLPIEETNQRALRSLRRLLLCRPQQPGVADASTGDRAVRCASHSCRRRCAAVGQHGQALGGVSDGGASAGRARRHAFTTLAAPAVARKGGRTLCRVWFTGAIVALPALRTKQCAAPYRCSQICGRAAYVG